MGSPFDKPKSTSVPTDTRADRWVITITDREQKVGPYQLPPIAAHNEQMAIYLAQHEFWVAYGIVDDRQIIISCVLESLVHSAPAKEVD